MNIYFDKEEEAFIRSQEKGWVRELVHQAILRQGVFSDPVEILADIESQKLINAAMKKEVDILSREHEPVRDVFGPGLKRR